MTSFTIDSKKDDIVDSFVWGGIDMGLASNRLPYNPHDLQREYAKASV